MYVNRVFIYGLEGTMADGGGLELMYCFTGWTVRFPLLTQRHAA